MPVLDSFGRPSEVSDKDPVKATASTAVQEPSTDDAEFEPVSPKSEREGLPPGYRMRADAHYVEHLTSRRERVVAEAARAAEGERAEKLLAQLAEDLATIESAVTAMSGDGSKLARRVNVDLLKSQVWRASWALRAHALVSGTGRTQIRPRPLAFLLGQVRHAWAAELRLLGVTLTVQASDWNAVVSVDEASLITGISGAIVATLGILGQPDGATIVVTATAAGGELRRVDVAQEDVSVGAPSGARFFDLGVSDRPGGWIAGLGAAAARAAAQQHGGDASLDTSTSGSTITLAFARR